MTTIQTLNNLESYGTIRGKINSNDGALNSGKLEKNFTVTDLPALGTIPATDDLIPISRMGVGYSIQAQSLLQNIDYSITNSATDLLVDLNMQFNDTGFVSITDFTVSGATITDAGLMIAADKVKLDGISGTNTGDQTATTVANTPAGNIAATTVQGAINELDSEKAASGANTDITSITAFRPVGTSITGTTYTLALTDSNKFISASNAAAQAITIPANATVAFPIGTEIEICQDGAGQVSFVAAGGVTIQSKSSGLKIYAQFTAVLLKKVATDTWKILGSITV